MRTIDAVRRSGVGIGPERTVAEAAGIMEAAGVGSLAIVDGHHVVGVVTDRDLVRRALAKGVPPDARVDSVMTTPVVTIAHDGDVHDAFALFRTHGIRRLVVVRDGAFAGILTIDDLLVDVAGDLADLARPVTAEILFAHRDAPVPAAV